MPARRPLFACLAFALAFVGTSAARAQAFGDAFWQHWGDGQAEMASYDLEFERYGQSRAGTAVAIFVTETFSHELRVKADPGKHPDSDTFPVLKLNLVEDFATGVYDYNLMTSSFVALTSQNGHPAGTPTKVSHSMQEWCGHAWVQMRFDAQDVDYTLHSYFDGEADRHEKLSWPAGGTSEDFVLLWARGFAAPFLPPGSSETRPMLRAAKELRLRHVEPSWSTVEYRRGEVPAELRVPAGEFTAVEHQIRQGEQVLWRVWVEAVEPHRVLRWESASGQRASLVAETRMPYWQFNATGGEAMLDQLGLQPRPPRTP